MQRPALLASSRPCLRWSTRRFPPACISRRSIRTSSLERSVLRKQQARDWFSAATPRRAGVTSLASAAQCARDRGRGGRRPAHPPQEDVRNSHGFHKDRRHRRSGLANLAAHLAEHPELNFADVAFTCQLGRTAFPHRAPSSSKTCESPLPRSPVSIAKGSLPDRGRAAPVFLFSGQARNT